MKSATIHFIISQSWRPAAPDRGRRIRASDPLISSPGPLKRTTPSSLVSRLQPATQASPESGHDAEVDARFESNTDANMFRGVFDSREAAAVSAPPDVPAVVARGREFAIQRGAPATLEFSEAIDDIDGVDVVFASGSRQYLPETLPDVLRRNGRRP